MISSLATPDFCVGKQVAQALVSGKSSMGRPSARMRELHEDSRGALGDGRKREELAEAGENARLNRVHV